MQKVYTKSLTHSLTHSLTKHAAIRSFLTDDLKIMKMEQKHNLPGAMATTFLLLKII